MVRLKRFANTDREPLLFWERSLLVPPPAEEHQLARFEAKPTADKASKK